LKPLSFVIITYNRPEDMLSLAVNISRLKDLGDLVEEVIVVNNCSSASYQPLETFIAGHPEIPFRYVVTAENLWVSRGRNYAVRQSRSPILLFLDDDALIKNDDALGKVVDLFQKEGDQGRPVGIAAFTVYYYETGAMQRNAFPHKRFKERKDWPHFETAYFSGCAHAIRRTVFEQVGYYPENFFYGMEEYDLSYRVLNAGFSIRYDNRVQILHKESPGGRLTPRQKLRGMWVNKSVVAWKYLPLRFFLTTALLWSGAYLMKSGFDLAGIWKGWNAIRQIPRTEPRTPVSKVCLDYLKRVKARLSY
jgi:GT2 family glycosyltransferase